MDSSESEKDRDLIKNAMSFEPNNDRFLVGELYSVTSKGCQPSRRYWSVANLSLGT